MTLLKRAISKCVYVCVCVHIQEKYVCVCVHIQEKERGYETNVVKTINNW